MKRSKSVRLVLLASAAGALTACAHKQCVDERDIVVDDKFCQTSSPVPTGAHGYRFYNSYFGTFPIGSDVRTGTIRGVFGGAGESASHAGGGEGGGEGAGE